MSGVYRGDFTAGNNTVTAINKGDFRTASEQFLKDSTGENLSKDYKKARETGSGVKGRLEAIQQAFAAEAARRESADRPEFAEPFTSRRSLVSRPKEPTPYERDSFATAEATADQMESLRKEKIARDLIKDEIGLRNNLTSEEQELLRTNQQIAFDEAEYQLDSKKGEHLWHRNKKTMKWYRLVLYKIQMILIQSVAMKFH